MDDVRRVTFRFADRMEVHYLPRAPEVGDFVTHGRDIWVVVSVRDDAVGMVAACERHGVSAPALSDDH